MIGKYLKHYRKVVMRMTLQAVEKKSGIGIGYISQIENNKTDPKNSYLVEFLIKGYNLRPSEAKDLVSEWRVLDSLSEADNPEKVLKKAYDEISTPKLQINKMKC